MTTSTLLVIECESVRVRCEDGSLFEFPIVDNKDSFPNFYRTEEAFNFSLKTNHHDNDIYAIYKRHQNIAYLVCAWCEKNEINDEALEIISSNPNLSYLIN